MDEMEKRKKNMEGGVVKNEKKEENWEEGALCGTWTRRRERCAALEKMWDAE